MSATTVLLLHSFGGSGRSWDAVRTELDLESRAPDLPGFGDAPPLARPSVAAYAAWVEARLSEAGPEVVRVGASMAGKIALALAARGLPALRALVLCAPSPPVLEPIADEVRATQLSAWWDRAAAIKSVGETTPALTPRWRTG